MRKSRLSRYKQNKLIELFVAGVTARTAAELVGVNKNTAAYYFHRLRLLIYQNSPHLEMFDGKVEADESYFAADNAKANAVAVLPVKSPYSVF
ncbi:putative insertion element IS1016 transposase [Neisseria meningitidis 65012]|nr:putative insertion element IS1016 transposase [Neisseria meningitidis 65012]